MADEFSSQPASLVQGFLKRENADHQIEETCHAWYSAAVPSPDLRTDVINQFPAEMLAPEVLGQSQIETRIVDKNHRVWLRLPYLAIHPVELFAKIGVLYQDVPQADDCLLGPIHEMPPGNHPHLWTTRSKKLQIWKQPDHFPHQ